jgi:hypothetical protein
VEPLQPPRRRHRARRIEAVRSLANLLTEGI